MVHSGSASPMTTTSSASPHLTAPSTAPPLQAAPVVPPPGSTTDQDLIHTPAKLVNRDFTSNLDLSQPTTPTPAETEPSVLTPAKALAPAQGPFNGRTSGRKRTPKACDCCGPNSKGHNVKMPGRGRGRGRGRARGRGGNSDILETPKRKVGGQLMQIRSFDLTKEEIEEEDDRNEKLQMTLEAADGQSQKPVTLNDGQTRNFSAPEKGDTGEEGKGGGDSQDVEMRLSGIVSRGAAAVRGRGRGALSGALGGANKLLAAPRTTLLQKQLQNKDAETENGGQTDLSTVKSPCGNGDTVDLSDTEPEEEAKEGTITVSEMENGLPESPLDLDSDMQVDQTPERTDSSSIPVTLSNGGVTTSTNDDHGAALMEVETSDQTKDAPPLSGPITVCSPQHRWALRDHWLYCRPGVWEKEMEDVLGGEDDGKSQNEDSREQITHMVHEFLESFYIKYGGFIPLAETDVLEHLKKKGSCDLSKRGLDIKEEMSRYRAALASAPVAGFMVTYNKHTLSLEDLGTLEEQNWLNDQIINMYGELIMEATQQKVHFFNSFFHKQLVAKGYEGVKRWTKKVDLFSKWLLLIPIHLEIHWSLITVTMATKTISYYDSQGIVFRHTTDNIMKYLLSEAREKNQTAFQKGWKITIIKGIPQQKNDSDCGVFVLEYCRCLSVKKPLLFSQEDMPRIRKRIYKELCDCRLND